MAVKSTVTLSDNTSEIKKIPTSLIIEEYKKAVAIDVSEYFKGLEFISIYQCNDTGYRFYYPDHIFGDAHFYAQLQKRDLYYSEWNWEHEQAKKNILPGSAILEVGCGTGSFIERMSKDGFSCAGLELNNEAVEVCKKKGLNVVNELIEGYSAKHEGKYDVVCAFQVLEHVYDVHSFLNGCIKCLKPGGKLIIGVPNNNPWYYVYDVHHAMNMPPHHSGIWDKKSFKKLASFFPVDVTVVKAEPLYNRVLFLDIFLKHKKWNGAQKLIKKIHPGIVNRLGWPLSLFIDGKGLFVIMEKR
jgi:SAM-dependent methyltransferase